MLTGREGITFQAQESTGADLYIIIKSMMPRGTNTQCRCNSGYRGKKTQSMNAVKARTLRIILYQLTNRYRRHSSLDNECRRKGVTLLSWNFLVHRKKERNEKEEMRPNVKQIDKDFGGSEDFGATSASMYLYPPTA